MARSVTREEFVRVLKLPTDLICTLANDWDIKFKILLVVYFHHDDRYPRFVSPEENKAHVLYHSLGIPIDFLHFKIWVSTENPKFFGFNVQESWDSAKKLAYQEYGAFVTLHKSWLDDSH